MVVVNIMIGLCSPPYGLLLLMMASVTGVPLKDIVRDMMPFHVAMIAALVLITYVPGIALGLPRLLGYQG